jgi:uncharacterized repeat protein (TIGR04138 family)
MPDESLSLLQLINQDRRYPIEAYLFIREALAFASDAKELGTFAAREPEQPDCGDETGKRSRRERHLTGQELCEAIRQFAVNQYGYMAKVVLNRWGIRETRDFGEIVYNMINVGIMKKSNRDRKSHFDGVYDFDDVFENEFAMCCSKTSRRL